jgi:hypothetical protein
MGARADLLRQLQQAVEQSESPGQFPIDPSQLDPKMMQALMNLAGQLGDNPELSPQMLQWLKVMSEREGLSVPPDLKLPPGAMPDGPHAPPGPVPGQPDRDPVFDLRDGNPGGFDPNQPPRERNNSEPNATRPNQRSNSLPGGQNRNGSPRPFSPDGARNGTSPAATPGERPAGGNRTGPGEPTQNQLPREGKAEEKSSAPRNINLEQLRESGLSIQQQFDRVVEQARRDAILHRSQSAGEEEAGGFGGLFNEALAKSSEELVERMIKAREGKSGKRAENRRGNAGERPPSRKERQENSPLRNSFQSLSNQAQRLGRSITDAPATAAAAATPETEFTVPSASTGFSVLIMIMAVVSLVSLAYAAIFWKRSATADHQRSSQETLPTQLTTKREVIDAFHTLSGMTEAREHAWWTHRRAESALAKAAPQARSAVAALTQVYEQARYLPAGEPLNADQLRVAGDAVSLLGKSTRWVIQQRGAQ